MSAVVSETVLLHQLDSWQDALREHAGRMTVVGVSKDANAKVVTLLFDRGCARPVLVAKVPTTDEAERQVVREFRALVDIRARLGPQLLPTVPEPLRLLRHRRRVVLVTNAVPGQTGLARYHSWRHTARPLHVRSDFDAAGRWLAEFQSATASGLGPVEPLADVAPAVAARFEHDGGLPRVLECLEKVGARLGRHRTVRSAVHGDYWFGNLLFGPDGLTGVVDWEMAVPSGGEPLHDLARFFLGYSLYLDRHASPRGRVAGHRELRAGPWGAGVEFALDGAGWFPSIARGFLNDGLQRLGVPAELGRDVILTEIATVAAQADDEQFASDHLHLLLRLSESGG